MDTEPPKCAVPPRTAIVQRDAVAPAVVRERFVVVSTSWCVPCLKWKAEELPTLRKSFAVEIVSGGADKVSGVTAYPTFIYERDGKEVWRTVGYTTAETLTALARK